MEARLKVCWFHRREVPGFLPILHTDGPSGVFNGRASEAWEDQDEAMQGEIDLLWK
jgi:hypothetical protein